MIYEYPKATDPIRQGDIFVGLPRVEISLTNLILEDHDGIVRTTWDQVIGTGKDRVTAVLPIRVTAAIVISQDCDCQHGYDVTLCEIRDFREVERSARDTAKVAAWVKMLTQQARKNLKWFYLPPDPVIGFESKQAVDFAVTMRVPTRDLTSMAHLRRGRLISLADEHFRERLSEFFRRYPYDEWYPLSQEEFAAYAQSYPDVRPFPWQIPGGASRPEKP